MIDFEPTPHDAKVLAAVREQALVCRSYARYYDENEHEFPPDELPESKDHTNPYVLMMKGRSDEDTSLVAAPGWVQLHDLVRTGQQGTERSPGVIGFEVTNVFLLRHRQRHFKIRAFVLEDLLC